MTRTKTLTIGAASLGVVAAGAVAAWKTGLLDRLFAGGDGGHAAPDLALDRPHNDGAARAPEPFRPDPTAAVPADEREGLRPAPMAG